MLLTESRRDFIRLAGAAAVGIGLSAGSSARLSPMIMKLGEAAGTAAAMAVLQKSSLRQVGISALQAGLDKQVTGQW